VPFRHRCRNSTHVLHGAGSKDLERLGGVLRRMPATGSALIVGAIAIAGLPPLNGFASEWLVYLGLMGGGLELGSGAGLVLFLVTTALATIGVLATLCFVRLIGVCLLGQPRSEAAAHAHESPLGMLAPLVLLASACAAMALFARGLTPMLGRVVGTILGTPLDLAPAARGVGTSPRRPGCNTPRGRSPRSWPTASCPRCCARA
jgi:formate hydrogenlyase subunit 3/multisubunit Na+/H+ antiporter MnhD subunit